MTKRRMAARTVTFGEPLVQPKLSVSHLIVKTVAEEGLQDYIGLPPEERYDKVEKELFPKLLKKMDSIEMRCDDEEGVMMRLREYVNNRILTEIFLSKSFAKKKFGGNEPLLMPLLQKERGGFDLSKIGSKEGGGGSSPLAQKDLPSLDRRGKGLHSEPE